MKQKFTFLMFLLGLLVLLPDKANAWTSVVLKHNINGVSWGSNDRYFTKTDTNGNQWKLEINCSEENITGDFWFRIWVSDNSKQWGPYDPDYALASEQVYGAREEYSYSFKIPQSSRRHGKITIYASYINDSKWEISYGGEGWMPTETTIDTYNASADDYYFVSPELTNSQCLEYFKLQPSRPRYAGSAYSGRFFTYHLQDFTLGSNSAITYWIQQKSTGKKFYPGGDGSDYELGSYDMANDNSGQNVIYQSYGTTTTTGTVPYKFKHTKNFNGSTSITIMFDDNGDGSVQALLNQPYCGTGSDAGKYYLIGNFSDTSHLLDPTSAADRKELTKYWFKNGVQYSTEVASPDSICYRVTVPRPGSSWASLYMLVFDENTINSWPGDAEGYAKAIRPQTQWNYTLGAPASAVDGTSHGYYEGLDATATRGGLYSRKSSSADTQQALNPSMSDDITSYTFSMNITTSTYTLSFNKKLFIMGPAVNDGNESTATGGGWSNASPEATTDHAYELTYNAAGQYYSYSGGVPLTYGKKFAFVYNKDFTATVFDEDDNAPVVLASNATTLNEQNTYAGVGANNDTQYVNFLKETTTSATLHTSAVSDINFGLPTGTYDIKLYVKELDGVNYVYYVIENRDIALKKVTNASDKDGFAGKALRTFADYHAVQLSTDVTPYYITSYKANPAIGQGSVTVAEYTLGANRVLPANTPVILVAANEATNYLTYYGANPKATGTSAGEYLKPAIATGTSIASHEGTTYDNFVFGYKDLGDGKNTIGFYHPASGFISNINSAYIQLPYNYLSDAAYFVLRFSGDLTGISDEIRVQNEEFDSPVYDVQGRKVANSSLSTLHSSLPRGIYIVNGKKVIIK